MLTRALTASLLFFLSFPAFADSYDADALLYLQKDANSAPHATPTDTLKATAEAHPDLEWREGSEGESDSMVMLSDVLFNFGEATLNPNAVTTLGSIAKELQGVPGIEIAGHTDSIGSEDGNLKLAHERAEAVRTWLIENAGVSPDLLTSVSMGETQPIAANQLENGKDNPEGRSKNRRVEFHILEETPSIEPIGSKTTAGLAPLPTTSSAI